MQFIMSGNWITANNHKEEFVVHVYNGIVAAVVVAADCDPFNYSTQPDTTTRPTPTYQSIKDIHKILAFSPLPKIDVDFCSTHPLPLMDVHFIWLHFNTVSLSSDASICS